MQPWYVCNVAMVRMRNHGKHGRLHLAPPLRSVFLRASELANLAQISLISPTSHPHLTHISPTYHPHITHVSPTSTHIHPHLAQTSRPHACHLRPISVLEMLALGANPIGAAGAAALARAARGAPTLRLLDLRGSEPQAHMHCMLHVHCMCSACALHVQCICSACAMHMQGVCTARALRVRVRARARARACVLLCVVLMPAHMHPTRAAYALHAYALHAYALQVPVTAREAAAACLTCRVLFDPADGERGLALD